LLILLSLALLAPACGSSGSPTPSPTTTSSATAANPPAAALAQGDAAVVGDEHVTKSEIGAMVGELLTTARQEHQPVPKQGTAAYRALRDDAVNYFVSSFALEQRARQDFGISISPRAIDKQIAEIRDHDFGGSNAKMVAHFASEGIPESQLRIFERIQLAENELPKKLAARNHVRVSRAEAHAYYKIHLRSYTKIAPTREIRDVKVGSRQLAEELYERIRKGASFASVAARYSTETGSLKRGKEFELTEGSIAIDLSNAAFGLATGTVSQPLESDGSWYLVEPVAPSEVGTTPFRDVAGTIESTLAAQKTNDLVKSWVANLAHTACGEIRYRAGYRPSNTTCGST
jgi:parvulin-like peptidyl-prolyl isomerase